MPKTVRCNPFGEVVITKKSGQKTLRLHVHPTKGVRISIPMHIGYHEALDFLESKKEWVEKKLAIFEARKHRQQSAFTNGCTILDVTVSISHTPNKRFRATIIGNILNIYLPEGLNQEAEPARKFIRKAIEMMLKNKAIDNILPKLEFYAQKYGFSYNGTRIGNSRSRWGSCNSENRLIFSCYLMLLSEELINFVIIHELCHTVHKNHGPKFHDLVDRLTGGREKELNSLLKKAEHPLLFAD